MRCWTIAFAVLCGSALLCASTATTGEKGAPITIEFHGQSFYILTTSNGTRIAFDPHTIPAYFRRDDLPKADIVCISHNHPDHTRLEALEANKKMKVLRGLKTPSLKSDWSIFEETIGDI